MAGFGDRDQSAYDSWLKRLGRSIAVRRKRHGWTQTQAAERVGLDFKYYQDLEYGRRPVSTRTLFHIANGFECGMIDLMSEAECS